MYQNKKPVYRGFIEKKAFFSYGSGIPKRTQKIKLQIQCNIIRNTFQ